MTVMSRLPNLAAPLLIAALVTASCGGDGLGLVSDTATDGTVDSTSALPSTPDTADTSPASPSTSTTTVVSSTGSSATTRTSTTTSSPTLPGVDFDLAPPTGRMLSVIGVRHDDTLNVRELPGTDHAVVAELGPVADDVEATGRARLLPTSIWFEVTTADGISGWVNSSFTAQAGPVVDVTSEVVARLGEIPEEETMVGLGALVAETLAPTEGDGPPRITLTVAPSVGDLGEVTYDLVGLADDATAALRLHVFGQPTDGGEGFSLGSVESTDMCVPIRGVSSDGRCA